MSNQDHTFFDEYKDHRISALMLNQNNVWIFELKIASDHSETSTYNNDQETYKTREDARIAAMKLAFSMIDKNSPTVR